MKTSKKIISLLMCMLMVLTMVPMSVFAAEATEIDTVHIEGVPAPLYGQTVEEYYTAILDERGGGTLTVNDETFNKSAGKYGNLFDEGLEVKKNDTVLDSTSTELITEGNYYVAMTLYPADGYVIPADVAVTVDGAVSVEKDFDEYGSLIAYAKFEVKATEIDTIHIEGVPAPVYGQTIKSYYEAIEAKITDGTITVNDEVYDSTARKYGNLLDDGWNVRSEADGYLSSTSTDLIKEGTYYVAMWFLPDNGYVIPEDVNVIFDGAKSVKIEVEDDGCLDIRAEFEVEAPAPTEIDTVHIEGIPAPVYGQTVKEYNTVMYNGSMDGAHKINGSARVNNGEDIFYGNIELADWEYYNSEKSYLAPSSADALPSVYYLVHWLYPVAGYKFSDDVAVTVDGAVSVETELDEEGCLAVWAKFEIAPPTEIDTVHVEGMPVPVYGQTVEQYWEAWEQNTVNGTLTVNGEKLSGECFGNIRYNGNDLFDENMICYDATGAVFTPGTYILYLCLQSAKGHVFTDNLKVSIEGVDSANIEVEYHDKNDLTQPIYIYVKYDVCNHTYETVITKATLTKNGKIESKCSVCGDVESTETIAKIKSVTLSTTNYIYNGKNKTPKVTVKDANGKTLVKNTDYKLTVASKRSGIGRYTVKVTFIGNYSGSKNVYFYIKTGKPATVKSASQTTSSVKLSWSAVSGAAGYTVYRYSPSKKAYVKAGTTEGTSLTVSKLYAGTKYTFRVVSYGKTSAGKVYDSDVYALLKTATKTKTPELTKVTASSTKGKAYVYHTDVKGETGYTVYYSTKKDSGFKKYANFKADTTRCDITKLTSGKTYYFKVRTYIKTDSGYVYSAWSAVKSVKVK